MADSNEPWEPLHLNEYDEDGNTIFPDLPPVYEDPPRPGFPAIYHSELDHFDEPPPQMDKEEEKHYKIFLEKFAQKDKEWDEKIRPFRNYFEEHNAFKSPALRGNQVEAPDFGELAPFLPHAFGKPRDEEPQNPNFNKIQKRDSFRGWWFGPFFFIFIVLMSRPRVKSWLFSRDVRFNSRGPQLLRTPFRYRYSLNVRTNLIKNKANVRYYSRTFYSWFGHALFFGFYVKFFYPLHTSLPLQNFPPLIENIIHAGWVGLVPGFYFGLLKGRPFFLSFAGFVAGALYSFARSSDSFEWYRRKLLETKARVQNRDIQELELKYPIITRAAQGYYVNRANYEPINPEDAEYPQKNRARP